MPSSHPDVLTAAVTDFLRHSIRSLWTLELLLLMRERPERAWTAEQANRELRATLSLVTSRLEQLEAAGLLAREGADKWRYAPDSVERKQQADALAHAFRAKPFSVVNMLLASESYAKPWTP